MQWQVRYLQSHFRKESRSCHFNGGDEGEVGLEDGGIHLQVVLKEVNCGGEPRAANAEEGKAVLHPFTATYLLLDYRHVFMLRSEQQLQLPAPRPGQLAPLPFPPPPLTATHLLLNRWHILVLRPEQQLQLPAPRPGQLGQR